MSGGGRTGFSWYSMTTVKRWNIHTCNGSAGRVNWRKCGKCKLSVMNLYRCR